MDVSEGSTPKPAASVTVRDEVTCSHHVLFGRAVASGEKVRCYYLSRLFRKSPDHAQQANVEKKTLNDASMQNIANGKSGDRSFSITQSGNNTIDLPSSPNTLVNTLTDHPSPVDTEVDEEQQQLRAENDQLKSSIVELAKILSQEKKGIAAAEERATAAEERATAAEGRAMAAERRVSTVAERATNLGSQMERLSQDFETQVNRAAKAEAETMRLRLDMLGMQREFLPSDGEAVLEQDRPSNDLDQAKEDNDGLEVNLDTEDHEVPETPIEVAAGVFQDVPEDAAAASSTPMVEESILRTEMRAHLQTRGELDRLKERMRFKDGQLERHQAFLKEVTGELLEGQNGLQRRLDDANLRISELEVANHRLEFRIPPLQRQVRDLTNHARGLLNMLAQRDDLIRKGFKEFKFLIKLGTKLHARVKKAENMLKGTLGRDDRLMHFAEQRFPIRVPGDPYFGDVIDEEVDNHDSTEPELRLAIEGPRAEFFGEQGTELISEHEEVSGDDDIERLVDDVFEAHYKIKNGNAVDFVAEGPASNNSDFPNTEDVGSPGVTTATSEDTQKGSGFNFVFETPAQETRQTTEDTIKKLVFEFG